MRRHAIGYRPGVTGDGPSGPKVCDQEQWMNWMSVSTVMRIAVLVLFRSHVYTFAGRFFLQKKGGPIGLRSTCAIAHLLMLWLDLKIWINASVCTPFMRSQHTPTRSSIGIVRCQITCRMQVSTFNQEVTRRMLNT